MFSLGAVLIWVCTCSLVVSDFDADLKQISDEYPDAGNPSINTFLIVYIFMLKLYYESHLIISDNILILYKSNLIISDENIEYNGLPQYFRILPNLLPFCIVHEDSKDLFWFIF